MLKLDERDLKILSILQQEGRITKTALAQRVNLSPTPCWDRLKRLERAGVIEGYTARINPEVLGAQTTVLMSAQIGAHRARDFERFERAIEKRDEVLDCWAVGGGIDYLLRIVTPTVADYQQFVDRLLNADTGLEHYTTYIVTRQVKSSPALPDALLHALQSGAAA
mgnify:FL=1